MPAGASLGACPFARPALAFCQSSKSWCSGLDSRGEPCSLQQERHMNLRAEQQPET